MSKEDPKIINEPILKDMMMYKVVEIENENRIKVLACFFSPLIESVKDVIFSDDFEKMILLNKVYGRENLPLLDEIGAFFYK